MTFTPSKHWGARTLRDRHRGYGGFVLEHQGRRIYHAGDSAYFDGFKEIGERLRAGNRAAAHRRVSSGIVPARAHGAGRGGEGVPGFAGAIVGADALRHVQTVVRGDGRAAALAARNRRQGKSHAKSCECWTKACRWCFECGIRSAERATWSLNSVFRTRTPRFKSIDTPREIRFLSRSMTDGKRQFDLSFLETFRRYVPLAAWTIVILLLLYIPLKVIGYGYLPADDALRHAAKAVSGKTWPEILVLGPAFHFDPNWGWHWLLEKIHRWKTGCRGVGCVFSGDAVYHRQRLGGGVPETAGGVAGGFYPGQPDAGVRSCAAFFAWTPVRVEHNGAAAG